MRCHLAVLFDVEAWDRKQAPGMFRGSVIEGIRTAYLRSGLDRCGISSPITFVPIQSTRRR